MKNPISSLSQYEEYWKKFLTKINKKSWFDITEEEEEDQENDEDNNDYKFTKEKPWFIFNMKKN